ncbi:MAG: hypothetical protein FWC20_11905 [Oscillospiraceae bacterium]|nr:hypothetical protein [Oscillospiraceae bacterium]MCL2280088.1 hypothetical protein [Oscillospiraceae bacterium]
MKKFFVIMLILIALVAVVACDGDGDTVDAPEATEIPQPENSQPGDIEPEVPEAPEAPEAIETPQPENNQTDDVDPEAPTENIPTEELSIQIDAATDEFLSTFTVFHQVELGVPENGEGVALVIWANRPLSNLTVVGLKADLLEDRDDEWGFHPHGNFGYAELLQPGEAFVINNYMGLGTLPHLGISFTDESGDDTQVFFFQENHAYPEHGSRWMVQEIEAYRLIW